MGNSTNSMFYMAVLLIVIYLAGMGIFIGFQKFKKWREDRRDRHFREED